MKPGLASALAAVSLGLASCNGQTPALSASPQAVSIPANEEERPDTIIPMREAPDPMPEAMDADERLRHAIERMLRGQGIDVLGPGEREIPQGGETFGTGGRELTYIIVEPVVLDSSARVVAGTIAVCDDTDPGEAVWQFAGIGSASRAHDAAKHPGP